MKGTPGFISIFLAISFLACAGRESAGADAPAVVAPVVKADETNAQEILRGYIRLQEQLHTTQLTIEQNRRETAEAAARNAEILTARLQAIEGALASQRSRELETMQSSNRIMLFMAGAFAFIGVAAMVLIALFQWRTLHGLAAVSAGLPPAAGFHPGVPIAALGAGDDLPMALPDRVGHSNAKLIAALEQLEKRIHELEHTARPALQAGPPASAEDSPAHSPNGNGGPAGTPATGKHDVSDPEPGAPDGLRQLLSQGQELLDQDEPDRALACFEQALALDPRHGEALVKKGTALERLQKLDEAIGCYDQAIAADSSLTIAYLHKGGLFNRMERFGEALECYEQALRTQEKRAS